MPRPRFLLGFRWGRSARRAQSQTATQAAAWSKSKQVTENGWLMSMRLAFGTSTRRAEIARARAAYRSSRMRRATEKGTRLCLFALWLLVRRTRAPLPFELQGDSTWLCLSAAFWSSTLRSFQLPTPPPPLPEPGPWERTQPRPAELAPKPRLAIALSLPVEYRD